MFRRLDKDYEWSDRDFDPNRQMPSYHELWEAMRSALLANRLGKAAGPDGVFPEHMAMATDVLLPHMVTNFAAFLTAKWENWPRVLARLKMLPKNGPTPRGCLSPPDHIAPDLQGLCGCRLQDDASRC